MQGSHSWKWAPFNVRIVYQNSEFSICKLWKWNLIDIMSPQNHTEIKAYLNELKLLSDEDESHEFSPPHHHHHPSQAKETDQQTVTCASPALTCK